VPPFADQRALHAKGFSRLGSRQFGGRPNKENGGSPGCQHNRIPKFFSDFPETFHEFRTQAVGTYGPKGCLDAVYGRLNSIEATIFTPIKVVVDVSG
jgi:hypothetical protein